MEDLEIEVWMRDLTEALKQAFGSRLILVGLQGSRARDEARAGSDIDAVVVVDSLGADDLARYQDVIASLPHAELACGFVGSPEVLTHWPRYDVFNLVEDTRVFHGSFDFMDTAFIAEDALDSAKAGAAEIYHALVHTLVFEEEDLGLILEACLKSSFFVMRALQFAKTGEYPASRARMRELAGEQERAFLDAYEARIEKGSAKGLSNQLIIWVEQILATE